MTAVQTICSSLGQSLASNVPPPRRGADFFLSSPLQLGLPLGRDHALDLRYLARMSLPQARHAVLMRHFRVLRVVSVARGEGSPRPPRSPVC